VLARSIKKNAVRAVDLFREWDEDRNGMLSKKEFRAALKNTGIAATNAELDALFEKWDADGSGTLDFNELNKALKKGLANLKQDLDKEEDGGETLTLLGREKAERVKQAKEAKAEAKEKRQALSPRSQEEEEKRNAKRRAKREQLEVQWREDEATGRRWTAAKWLASRQVSAVVATALKLPALSEDSGSHFSYVKKLTRPEVEELFNAAGLSGLVDFMVESIETLSSQATGSAEQLNDKFSTTAKFQMT